MNSFLFFLLKTTTSPHHSPDLTSKTHIIGSITPKTGQSTIICLPLGRIREGKYRFVLTDKNKTILPYYWMMRSIEYHSVVMLRTVWELSIPSPAGSCKTTCHKEGFGHDLRHFPQVDPLADRRTTNEINRKRALIIRRPRETDRRESSAVPQPVRRTAKMNTLEKRKWPRVRIWRAGGFFAFWVITNQAQTTRLDRPVNTWTNCNHLIRITK